MARPETPSDLNDLHGNPGKRYREKSKGGPRYKYQIPKYFRGDQKKYIINVVAELYRLGKSRLIYQSAFDGWCQAVYLRDKAFDELMDADKLIIKGERGIDKKHPAIQMHKDFSGSVLRHGEKLGLDGLTSDRVRGSSNEDKNPMEV